MTPLSDVQAGKTKEKPFRKWNTALFRVTIDNSIKTCHRDKGKYCERGSCAEADADMTMAAGGWRVALSRVPRIDAPVLVNVRHPCQRGGGIGVSSTPLLFSCWLAGSIEGHSAG
jgi:hypothetical protein